MHQTGVMLHSREYPAKEHYPFNLPLFRATKRLLFDTPVTLFVGESGTGKSTPMERHFSADAVREAIGQDMASASTGV